jgi:hypothetical protein
MQKKKGKKDEVPQDQPKPMNLGFGALGALGSVGTVLSSNSNTEEPSVSPITSNFF